MARNIGINEGAFSGVDLSARYDHRNCCCHINDNNRHIRTASDPVVYNVQTTVKSDVAIKSNSYHKSGLICQNCKRTALISCNANNSSNKSAANEHDQELNSPPAYTAATEVAYTQPKTCTVNKGAAILVVVLVAIIACLVVALTFFLVSGKEPVVPGNENEKTLIITIPEEALINQTDRCGIFPQEYETPTFRNFIIPSYQLPPGVFHNNATLRVVGGAPASIKQYPWQVGLWVEGKGQTCGGSIILKNWILTAAHCTVANLQASAWVAYVGFTDSTKKHLPPAQKRKVTKIIQHPQYVDDGKYDYDISLMNLENDLIFNDKIQPACVPRANVTFKNTTSCYVSGWGATDSSGFSEAPRILQHAQIDLFDRSTCLNWLGEMVTPRMICAGKENGQSDACQGDSGGPLSCYSIDQDAWVLVGMVSWGIECGLEQLPGVYTNIAVFTKWIWENIGKVEGF